MKRLYNMRLAIVMTVCAAALAAGQSAAEIMKRSIDRDVDNFEQQKNYTYEQHEQDREFDSKGGVTKTETETSEVLILGGRPYEKVIAKNGKPLSESAARKEQDKMDRELAKRENLSDAQKARLEKERAENRKLLRQLTDAFTFRLDGEESISGKPAWLIDAEPNPDFKPTSLQAKLLTKLRGKVWVDQSEYQWVKAEAEVLDTISLGLALFRLSPGGVIRFEQTRVNDELWLPAHVFIRADARIAYVKKIRTEIELNFRGYKKFQTESKIVSVAEKN
jgi:hypothetical protein